MQDQIEEATSFAPFHKLTGICWTIIALMGALWVGHLVMSNRAATEERMPSVTQELATASFPTAQTRVYAQGLGKYHWQTECPLASAKSLRRDGVKVTIRRTTMTAIEAEQHRLMPCLYCVEMKN